MKKSGMITAATALGDSIRAMENAQDVLDSRGEIEKYLQNAKDAKSNLEVVGENADEAAKSALVGYIRDIDSIIEDIQEILDDERVGSLADYIAKVTLADYIPGDVKEPRTPSEIADEVAKSIFDALEPNEVAGAAPIGLGVAAADAVIPDNNVVRKNNHLGIKWEDFINSIGRTRIIDVPADETTKQVLEVVSVEGDPVEVHSTITDFPGACDVGADDCLEGNQHSVSWKGIDGTIFCLGEDCELEGTGDSRDLTGSWFFTPDALDIYYLRKAGEYEVEVYVEYGYWLDESGAENTSLVNTFSHVKGTESPVAGTWGDNAALEAKATYSGNAIGLYSMFSGSGDNMEYVSGPFSADVELNAVFGAGDVNQLSGVIDEFRDEDDKMIGSNWSVTLNSIEDITDVGVIGDGTTGRNSDGAWTANSIADDAGSRPRIIHGTFNAHFNNGDVAGAYATRKD